MVPFVTIAQRGQPIFSMFDDLPGKYHWALPLLEYPTPERLLSRLVKIPVAHSGNPGTMLIHNARQQMGMTIGAHHRPGKPAPAPSVRIPDRGESNPPLPRSRTAAPL